MAETVTSPVRPDLLARWRVLPRPSACAVGVPLGLAQLAWGSALVYAAIHHFGGETGKGHKVKLPARPVMGIGQRQESRITDLLIAEIRSLQ